MNGRTKFEAVLITLAFAPGFSSAQSGVGGVAVAESPGLMARGLTIQIDGSDRAVDTPASVGNFSVYFEQTGDYSELAGNTAPRSHSTGIFAGTTGTGGGYNSFRGIVSGTPFSSITFTAQGDGDRFRLDNVAIAR